MPSAPQPQHAGVSRRRQLRRSPPRRAGPESALHRRADLLDGGAGSVHPHRVTRDVDAHRSAHAVKGPGHLARGGPGSHEAVQVGPVASSLASAVAGDVPQHLGMPGGELVRLLDELAASNESALGERWKTARHEARGGQGAPAARRRVRSLAPDPGADDRSRHNDAHDAGEEGVPHRPGHAPPAHGRPPRHLSAPCPHGWPSASLRHGRTPSRLEQDSVMPLPSASRAALRASSRSRR